MNYFTKCHKPGLSANNYHKSKCFLVKKSFVEKKEFQQFSLQKAINTGDTCLIQVSVTFAVQVHGCLDQKYTYKDWIIWFRCNKRSNIPICKEILYF